MDRWCQKWWRTGNYDTMLYEWWPTVKRKKKNIDFPKFYFSLLRYRMQRPATCPPPPFLLSPENPENISDGEQIHLTLTAQHIIQQSCNGFQIRCRKAAWIYISSECLNCMACLAQTVTSYAQLGCSDAAALFRFGGFLPLFLALLLARQHQTLNKKNPPLNLPSNSQLEKQLSTVV